MDDLVHLESVSKTYHIADINVPVLQGINLAIHEGEYVAIMGPSGSGKSTLMNIIGCLDIPSEGKYFLSGRLLSESSEGELARVRARYIGFVFQSFNLVGSLNSLENVSMPLMYQGMRAQEQRVRATEMLTRVGLKDRLRHRPSQLSGGQQQRVAIARAIVTDAPLILADEPTGNLDSHAGHDILDLFRQLHEEGHTIVIITHDAQIAEQTERIIEIRDGLLVEDRKVGVH